MNSYSILLRGRIKKFIEALRAAKEEKKAGEELIERLRNDAADLAGELRVTQAASDQFEFLAYHDEPTGLYNRRAFIGLVNGFLSASSRSERNRRKSTSVGHCLVFLDVINFKLINDESGHIAGDMAIRLIADTLRARLRHHHDVYCRWGGDEFLLFLPDTNPSELEHMVQDLNEDMAQRDHRLKVRYGASYFREGDDFDRMIGRADDDLRKKYHQEKRNKY